MKSRKTRWHGFGALLMLQCGALQLGCGSDPTAANPNGRGTQSDPIANPAPTNNASSSAGASAPVTPATSTSSVAGGAAPVPVNPAAPKPAVTPPVTMVPPVAAPPPPAAAPGPDDGDPNKPVIGLTDVKCKPANATTFGLGTANFKVDNRDVIIDYPCNKHEGAPVTFILNLHGTSPVNTHFYQEGYFSAFKYLASNNLIIATPSAVDQQWGNNDNGADLPYLMNVIDWVYKNLGTKFDIRSMWVGGHSWGAMYTATFGCKPELADKVRGLIIMSGSPVLPACASKMSIIDTNAEMDIAAPLDQGTTPMSHGCKASQMMMLGNNTQTLWPDCTKGFVHSNYLMLGKMHTDFMDDVVVKSIVDLIKQARP
jgi:hypothetical protein